MRLFTQTVALFLVLVVGSTVNATNGMLEIFNAITQSKALKEIVKDGAKDNWYLSEISHQATYRCVGCYGFDVVLKKYDADTGDLQTQTRQIGTRVDLQTGAVLVSIDPQ